MSLRVIKPDEDLKPLITGIATGSDPGLEKQLIEKSRQRNILRFTPNDAAKRFGDPEMLKRWLEKGREIHWLLGADNDLAGIIWYGKSPFPADADLPDRPDETFAIRLYEGYTGHRLAVPFMRQSLGIYARDKLERGDPIKGIWLETNVDNPAALASYTKFGYHEVARDDKRVTMVLGASSIKEYM